VHEVHILGYWLLAGVGTQKHPHGDQAVFRLSPSGHDPVVPQASVARHTAVNAPCRQQDLLNALEAVMTTPRTHPHLAGSVPVCSPGKTGQILAPYYGADTRARAMRDRSPVRACPRVEPVLGCIHRTTSDLGCPANPPR
jgi:hypothetical protein